MQSSPEYTATSPVGCQPGAVIETIGANSAAEKAGLKEGDAILGWARGDTKGKIESPFDVPWIELEQSERGPVTLEGRRGTEKRTWTFGPGDWKIETRPDFTRALLALYLQGQEAAKAGNLAQAAERWQMTISQLDHSAPAWLPLWLLYHTADTFAEGRQWKDADTAYQQAVTQAAAAGPLIKGQILRKWAHAFMQRSDWANAEKYYQQAAEEHQKLNPESLLFAATLNNMAIIAFQHGDLARAEKYCSRALALQQKLAPGSYSVATSLSGLGIIARFHGDLATAERYQSDALAIREAIAPNTLEVAESLNNLGILAAARGQLEKAEEYYQKVLTIRQKLAPDSHDLATTFINLGAVSEARGNLDQAEKRYSEALTIYQKLTPDSLEVARCFNNLGVVNEDRGDLVKAEEYYSKGLAIIQKLAPGSLLLAQIFDNLGIVASDRGDLMKAEKYILRSLAIEKKLARESLDVAETLDELGTVAHQRGDLPKAELSWRQALDIIQKQAPESEAMASTLDNLGNLARETGHLKKAEEYQSRSLALREKLAPESLKVAFTLSNLGLVAQARGDVGKAEEYYRRALEIRQKLAPGSVQVADSLSSLANLFRDRNDFAQAEDLDQQVRTIEEKVVPESKEYAAVLADLAGIMLRKGQLDRAAPLFEQALNALEGQTAHLGGAEEVRSNFRARYLSYYQDYVDLLMRQKQPERAFQVLERSRARTLLEMQAEAHLDVHQGVDAALLERKHSLDDDLSGKYNRRIRLLNGKHTDEQIAAVNQEIDKLLAQHKDVEEQLRATSPAYAALTQQKLLGAQEVQQLLDDDTLLLEYSLGRERSYLFVLTSNSIEAFPLPAGDAIEATARRAHEELSVNNPAAGHDAITELSNMLLTAITAHADKKRLAIVPDGALQYVSFNALRTPAGAPLLAEHEIVELASASTLAVLRKEAETRKPAPRQVAILADPVFDSNDERLRPAGRGDVQRNKNTGTAGQEGTIEGPSADDLLTRSAADLGMTAKGAVYLPRLLNTREEAQNILAVASAGQAIEALDFDASRATALSGELANYRIVHFATHGLLNSTHPELSGLVLSLVDKQGKPQNGFLGLQDIYNLHLSADLVVLSACETGLGKEIRGEGLVGLTRAFMYAGAPRVVASLWRVPDRATAELMKRFYRAMLVEGLRPAAALRQAQISLSKEKRWSAPYYWAGFTLQGEWK